MLIDVFLLPEFEEFYVFRTYLVFMLVFASLWSLSSEGWWQLFALMFTHRKVLTQILDFSAIIMGFLVRWTTVWLHNFELFLETWFINFTLFELFLKRGDISEGSDASSLDVVSTSILELKIAIFPKIFFLLNLLILIINFLEMSQKNSSFIDKPTYYLFELLRIVFPKFFHKFFLFLHDKILTNECAIIWW